MKKIAAILLILAITGFVLFGIHDIQLKVLVMSGLTSLLFVFMLFGFSESRS